MRQVVKMWAAALAIALVVAACGGGDGPTGEAEAASQSQEGGAAAPDGQGRESGTSGSDGAAPPSTAGNASKGDSKDKQSEKSTTSTTPGSDTSGTVPEEDRPVLPVETTLGSTCVRAGGTQTVTFKTVPGSGVAYNSYYSDGKNGLDEGFYGGNKGAIIQADGQWTDTWTIAPHAPPGKVRVTYTATNIAYRAHHGETSFELVSPTGVCP